MVPHRPRAATTADPHLVPPALAAWSTVFRSSFTAPMWNRVLVLVAGAVLAPGKRTVSRWYNAQQRRLLVATGSAVWYHAGIAPVPIRWVLVRDPTGEHEPAAFFSTDLGATPAIILGWFISRWRVKTTFQEVRTHLGVETQRQWSDLAILGTTPALLGLFSLVTVWADGLARGTTTALRQSAAARYRKQEPTFSDAIAAMRRVLWCPPDLSMSRQPGEVIEILTALLNRVFQTLCLAA
jgi:hypothetical protein